MPLTERTVPYKTWIKQSLVEALQRVFNAHVDELLTSTHVGIEYPTTKARYPAIVVRFFERDINNAGIGHDEILTVDGLDFRFKHYFYSGDIEFAIHALSSYDRDLISDSLVQILGMGDLTEYTNHFYDRIYEDEFSEYPKAMYNYINLNVDRISGFGETQTPAPWQPEDQLVYQTSYRVGIAGEFYSLPPEEQDAVGYVERVDQFPYIEDLEPIPEGNAEDDTPWQPPILPTEPDDE
jgi:hypothetical protein